MITVNVFFQEYDVNYTDGTAIMYENLITNEIKVILNNHLVLNEINYLMDKLEKNLKSRYKDIQINMNWGTANKEEKK